MEDYIDVTNPINHGHETTSVSVFELNNPNETPNGIPAGWKLAPQELRDHAMKFNARRISIRKWIHKTTDEGWNLWHPLDKTQHTLARAYGQYYFEEVSPGSQLVKVYTSDNYIYVYFHSRFERPVFSPLDNYVPECNIVEPIVLTQVTMKTGDIEDLKALLSLYPEIDIREWSKTIYDLHEEIKNGECVLLGSSEELVRYLHIVNVYCVHGKHLLFEDKQVFDTTQETEPEESEQREGIVRHRNLNHLTEKLLHDEVPEIGALRALKEELQITPVSEADIIKLDNKGKKKIDDRCIGYINTHHIPTSYVGIKSNFKATSFVYNVPDDQYKEIYTEVQPGKKTTYFKWIKIY